MCWNSSLPSKRRAWGKGNSPTTEGVDAAPTTWDVEQFELAKHRGDGWINEKVVASRLQAEHRTQQQERCPAGPGLWATRGWVFHRKLRQLTRIASERLRQTTLEVGGRLEHAHGDTCVVVWPDRPEMIANRVVATLAFRHGADAPTRIKLGAHQVAYNSFRLVLLDDATPEQVPNVGGQRINLAPVAVDGEREKLTIFEPEVLVKPAL